MSASPTPAYIPAGAASAILRYFLLGPRRSTVSAKHSKEMTHGPKSAGMCTSVPCNSTVPGWTWLRRDCTSYSDRAPRRADVRHSDSVLKVPNRRHDVPLCSHSPHVLWADTGSTDAMSSSTTTDDARRAACFICPTEEPPPPAVILDRPVRLLHLEPSPRRPALVRARLVLGDVALVPALDRTALRGHARDLGLTWAPTSPRPSARRVRRAAGAGCGARGARGGRRSAHESSSPRGTRAQRRRQAAAKRRMSSVKRTTAALFPTAANQSHSSRA
jgi:hypothetical protein